MESTSEPRKIHISNTTYGLLKKTGCFVCEERGLTFIKGKGEMRTFWLKGEDKTKLMEMKLKSKVDEWNKTPDLLCIDNIHVNDADQIFFGNKYSTKSLNNIDSSFLYNALTDQKFAKHLPPLNISKNFPSHDCYLCQKKKYLYQKYHQELRHKCEKFSATLNIDSPSSSSSDSLSMRNGCSCSKKSHNESNPSRSPSSAPHIIFKE